MEMCLNIILFKFIYTKSMNKERAGYYNLLLLLLLFISTIVHLCYKIFSLALSAVKLICTGMTTLSDTQISCVFHIYYFLPTSYVLKRHILQFYKYGTYMHKENNKCSYHHSYQTCLIKLPCDV